MAKVFRIEVLISSKSVRYFFCACVENMHKTVILVIVKLKFASFSLFAVDVFSLARPT